MINIWKRFTVGLMSVMLLICSASVNVYAEENADNAEFDAFLESEFTESMETDYMTLHYTVKDYKALGIEKPDAVLDTVDLEDYTDAVEDADESIADLKKFDYETLSDSQQTDYDIYLDYLNKYKALNEYPMLDFYFSPSTGIFDNLMTIFTEFVIYEKEDIEDYLSYLASVEPYVVSALEFTKTQAADGYFMTDTALDQILSSMEKFTEKKEDNALIVIFDENIDAYEGLSDAEREDYKARNRDIVLNSYIPAFENAAEVLETLRSSRSIDGGLCEYEDGAEYYETLVQYKTSSSMTVQEVSDLADEYLKDVINRYVTLLYSNNNIEDQYNSETVEQTTPDEALSFLSKQLEDYPEGPDVTYTISSLDASVADDAVTAYYVNPPFDDFSHNVIKVNDSNISDVNSMYETLAHEGYPGHLYQMTWFQNTNPRHIRAALSHIGYTEGWAMYAEIASYGYSSLSEDVQEMHILETELGYVMDAQIDLMVNGLGYSTEEVSEWMDEIGLNSEAASYYIDYVLEYPGQLLPYGIGLVRFENLKSTAEEQMQDSFDLKEFNTVLLTNGDRPFEMVEEDVNAYIASGSTSAVISDNNKSETSQNGQTGIVIAGVAAVAVIAAAAYVLHKKKKNHDAL